MKEYVSLEEAISISVGNITQPDGEYVHIDEACLRVAADNIASPFEVPAFDRSTMDGFTIDQCDLDKLQTGTPVSLKIAAIIKAGSIARNYSKSGETYKIMTGALLPSGTAAVVKQEDIIINENFIVVENTLKQGENIQRAGHEVRAGDTLITKGQILKAELLERAAACGVERFPVCLIPRVYVINTGSELRLPGLPLEKGQIYGSNRYLIAGKIIGNGAIPVLATAITEDDLTAIANEIEKAISASNMVIISGGTGNGLYDLVYQAFQRLNAKILFKGINIVPGKGTSAAIINDKILFSLSGSPYAAAILFEALIRPALDKLKGDLFSNHPWFNIELISPMSEVKPMRSLHRGQMIIDEKGIYARPVSRKDHNHYNFPIILDIPAGQGQKGDMVKAKLY